jgi:hypothetical protein
MIFATREYFPSKEGEMCTLINIKDHQKRIADGKVVRGNGLTATLARATMLFHFGGLPKITCEFNIQIFQTQMECRLSHFCLAKKIEDMDYYCGMCALGVFSAILSVPYQWLRRNFEKEFQKEENLGILTDAGYTALFFLTFAEKLAPSVEKELISIGSYLFDKHFFFTGKDPSLHLRDNLLGVRDVLQKIQTSYF